MRQAVGGKVDGSDGGATYQKVFGVGVMEDCQCLLDLPLPREMEAQSRVLVLLAIGRKGFGMAADERAWQ